MENNSFLQYLDDIILEREETQTFTAEDRFTSHSGPGFRWVVLYREQVLATERFYNDADDAITDQMSFNEMQPKTAFDVQRELSESLGPTSWSMGSTCSGTWKSPDDLVLPGRIRLHRGLDGGLKLPLRGA